MRHQAWWSCRMYGVWCGDDDESTDHVITQTLAFVRLSLCYDDTLSDFRERCKQRVNFSFSRSLERSELRVVCAKWSPVGSYVYMRHVRRQVRNKLPVPVSFLFFLLNHVNWKDWCVNCASMGADGGIVRTDDTIFCGLNMSTAMINQTDGEIEWQFIGYLLIFFLSFLRFTFSYLFFRSVGRFFFVYIDSFACNSVFYMHSVLNRNL